MKVRAGLLGFVGIWALSTSPLKGSERLAMVVTPAVAFAPSPLNVRVIVEAHRDNRIVEVVAESTNFYRSSQIELQGEHAPRTSWFQFRDLPSGYYNVSAALIEADGDRLMVRRTMRVIAGVNR